MIGEGEFNLDSLKEFKVTDSYLGLEKDARGCQNEEPMENCTTRHYNDKVLWECGCLPININMQYPKVSTCRETAQYTFKIFIIGSLSLVL